MRFADRLRHAVDAANSLLCVGLDPQPERTAAHELLSFNRGVIEATGEFVCAFKPQSAFYEAAGELGWDALARTIELIRELAPHAVVVLDAKRGDIANTARAYASAAFELLGADAITASPYLGADSVAPFLEHPERGAFVLCRTSNPGSGDFQSLRVVGPQGDGRDGREEALYERVARRAAAWSNDFHQNVGLVVGATYPAELARVRAVTGSHPADPAARDRRAGRRSRGGAGRRARRRASGTVGQRVALGDLRRRPPGDRSRSEAAARSDQRSA